MALTVADSVVLALLAEGPRHGYAVHAELARRDVEDWAAISRPQIYYSLKKMEQSGYLRVKEDGHSLGPERRLFQITSAGRRELVKALGKSEWVDQRPPAPFVTWLALCWVAPVALQLGMVRRRRVFLTQELEKERGTLVAIRGDGTVTTRIPELMVSLAIGQFEQELRWLDEVERALGEYTDRQS